MKKLDIFKKATILIFLIFIGFFSISNVLAPKQDFSELENRSLAKMPELSLASLQSGTFDDDFEDYFTDHFVGRDGWVQMKASARMLSGAIENNHVYFGKDERLISSFQTFNKDTLNQNVETINTFLKDNNYQGIVLLVPTASYGQRYSLPSGAYEIDQKELIDSLENQFVNTTYINLSEQMDGSEDLYYRTDHHWNHKGAKKAYDIIVQEVLDKKPITFTEELVSDSFVGTMASRSGVYWTTKDEIYKITPDIDDATVEVTLDNNQTLNSLLADNRLQEKDKYTYYLDGNHSIVTIKTSNPNGKKALIVTIL